MDYDKKSRGLAVFLFALWWMGLGFSIIYSGNKKNEEINYNPVDPIIEKYDQYDQNKDGRLDKEELTSLYKSYYNISNKFKENPNAQVLVERLVEDAFERFDKDKDFFLNKGEFYRLYNDYGFPR